MPGRKVHGLVGLAAGGAMAAYRAPEAPRPEQVVETLGGIVGGYLGGLVPDGLEPALHPNHRGIAHSLAALGCLGLVRLSELQAQCRTNAEICIRRKSVHAADGPERQKAEFEALAWRFVAGLIVGFTVGYASHLVLDAGTKRGLPLVW
jgi:membrane-bound metal-dependent hydrolase YbcI (DUF457 family)